MHIGRNRLEINLDLLVVTLTVTGQVITRVDNRIIGILFVMEAYQIRFVQQLAAFTQQNGRSITVHVGLLLHPEESACRLSRVPAKSYNDIGQSGVSLC
ncbi:hypothetical protein D3C86_1723760 [compost metagenome]